VLTLTQDRCTVCAELSIAQKWFRINSVDLLCDFGHVESCFNPLVTVVLVQDMCTVCAKRTIGIEIILDVPDSTPR
jgi:hypothetical protein